MAQPAFTRKKLLRLPDALMESVCAICGFSVIAGNLDSLDRLEMKHREECRPRKEERRKIVMRTGERRVALLDGAEPSTRLGVDQRKKDRRSGKERRVQNANLSLPHDPNTKRPSSGRKSD